MAYVLALNPKLAFIFLRSEVFGKLRITKMYEELTKMYTNIYTNHR